MRQPFAAPVSTSAASGPQSTSVPALLLHPRPPLRALQKCVALQGMLFADVKWCSQAYDYVRW